MSDTKRPWNAAAFIAELQAASGHDWDGVDSVAFVRELRGDDEDCEAN